MDLTEKKIANGNRHPWELSRAHCMLNIIKKYSLRTAVDIGAGDRFFTSKLSSFVSGALYAVDTGYDEREKIPDGMHCYDTISELPEFTTGGVAQY